MIQGGLHTLYMEENQFRLLFQVTFLFIVPPIALQLARSPLVMEYDLSTVRMLWCGAAPLGKDLQTELAHRFKTVPVKQGKIISRI